MDYSAQDFYDYLAAGNASMIGGLIYIICISDGGSYLKRRGMQVSYPLFPW